MGLGIDEFGDESLFMILLGKKNIHKAHKYC